MLPLVLVAVVAQTDGGMLLTSGSPVFISACPEVNYADGGHAEYAFPVERKGSFIEELPADAGSNSDWYMPYPRGQRSACRLAECEEKVSEGIKPWQSWLLVSSLVTGVLLGGYGMYQVCSTFNVCH